MKYELTLILDAAAEANAQVLTKVEKAVESVSGAVGRKEDWGLKHFTFPIKKKESGHYYFYSLEMAPAGIKKLQEKLRLMNEIVRYLVVVA